VVQHRRVCAIIQKSRQSTRPSADCARPRKAAKKKKPLTGGRVSLDKILLAKSEISPVQGQHVACKLRLSIV
jgi:hypothetical protein